MRKLVQRSAKQNLSSGRASAKGAGKSESTEQGKARDICRRGEGRGEARDTCIGAGQQGGTAMKHNGLTYLTPGSLGAIHCVSLTEK